MGRELVEAVGAGRHGERAGGRRRRVMGEARACLTLPPKEPCARHPALPTHPPIHPPAHPTLPCPSGARRVLPLWLVQRYRRAGHAGDGAVPGGLDRPAPAAGARGGAAELALGAGRRRGRAVGAVQERRCQPSQQSLTAVRSPAHRCRTAGGRAPGAGARARPPHAVQRRLVCGEHCAAVPGGACGQLGGGGGGGGGGWRGGGSGGGGRRRSSRVATLEGRSACCACSLASLCNTCSPL